MHKPLTPDCSDNCICLTCLHFRKNGVKCWVEDCECCLGETKIEKCNFYEKEIK